LSPAKVIEPVVAALILMDMMMELRTQTSISSLMLRPK